jgi:hypothetical protein
LRSVRQRLRRNPRRSQQLLLVQRVPQSMCSASKNKPIYLSSLTAAEPLYLYSPPVPFFFCSPPSLSFAIASALLAVSTSNHLLELPQNHDLRVQRTMARTKHLRLRSLSPQRATKTPFLPSLSMTIFFISRHNLMVLEMLFHLFLLNILQV